MNLAHPTTRSRRGFSLLEVLLATFILGIGLIMVASVFPVGANWTRESTENSIAQTIALNAVETIKARYSPNSQDGNHANQLYLVAPSDLAAGKLPNFVGALGIPLSERCYQFGNPQPYPAANPNACLFYWTALVRATNTPPGVRPGASHDLYIFVFRKGEATQTFSNPPAGSSLVNGTSDTGSLPNYPTYKTAWEPTLVSQPYSAGTGPYNSSNNPPLTGVVPPVGYIGVGVTSGTVFRQTLAFNYNNISNTLASPRPKLMTANENVIYAPAADGTTGSPLVYVYQTTLPF
ncbi:MAG: type IV pilus modification PilV family protein [Phycisphaerae bacterium]